MRNMCVLECVFDNSLTVCHSLLSTDWTLLTFDNENELCCFSFYIHFIVFLCELYSNTRLQLGTLVGHRILTFIKIHHFLTNTVSVYLFLTIGLFVACPRVSWEQIQWIVLARSSLTFPISFPKVARNFLWDRSLQCTSVSDEEYFLLANSAS